MSCHFTLNIQSQTRHFKCNTNLLGTFNHKQDTSYVT